MSRPAFCVAVDQGEAQRSQEPPKCRGLRLPSESFGWREVDRVEAVARVQSYRRQSQGHQSFRDAFTEVVQRLYSGSAALDAMPQMKYAAHRIGAIAARPANIHCVLPSKVAVRVTIARTGMQAWQLIEGGCSSEWPVRRDRERRRNRGDTVAVSLQKSYSRRNHEHGCVNSPDAAANG